jgi:hypothetical protein
MAPTRTIRPSPFRAFVDSSVFGGVFDDEFADDSKRFFEEVRRGRFIVLVSEILFREILSAPPQVRDVLTSIPTDRLEDVPLTEESVALTEAYIAAGAVSEKWQDDAAQIAMATIARADLLLSWNFRHIVNFDRIRVFNSVNLAHGYSLLDIRCPKEIQHEDADQEDL